MKQINTINNPFEISSDNNNMNFSQLSRVLTSAIRRASEAVTFFDGRAEKSGGLLSKAFFNYLSVKKDAQRVIIEKIVRCLGVDLAPRSQLSYNEGNVQSAYEGIDDEYENVFKTVHEKAADELEFYLSYAAVEKEGRIHSILLMLADLSREFLFDVKIWYLNHKGYRIPRYVEKPETAASDYTVAAALN